MIRAGRVAALALGAVVLVGCAMRSEVGGSNKPTPTTTPPVVQVGAIGGDFTAYDVTVDVVSIDPFDQAPNGTSRIVAVVRSENLGGTARRNPDLRLVCDETSNTGDWYLGSTWEPNAILPVNAVAEGRVIIGFPLKGNSPEYPVVNCTSARLQVTIRSKRLEEPQVWEIPVDEELIHDAMRRPRGPLLPLPRRPS